MMKSSYGSHLSPDVFTSERMSTLRSPIKSLAYGRVAFCDNFCNTNEARFKKRMVRCHQIGETPSPPIDGTMFQPHYYNTKG